MKDKRRRLSKKKLLERRRRRRRKRIAAVLISTVLVITAVLVGMRIKHVLDVRRAKLNQGDIIVTTGAYNKDTGRDSGRTNYTKETIHTGDLILVNDNYEYDFEANAEALDLVKIQKAQKHSYPVAEDDLTLAKHVVSALDQMLKDCDRYLGTEITGVQSAYRTSEYQQKVRDSAVADYGEEYAAKYVASPGRSEHHTGLALDIGIIYKDGTSGTFSGSPSSDWLARNSYRYGFIRRYEEEKISITGINSEEWHFRYVGIPHAWYMYQNHLCLEEYLEHLRQNTSRQAPLRVEADGAIYSIFYTNEPELEVPGENYEISGDNKKGWIFTVRADV